jgi:xylulokinase
LSADTKQYILAIDLGTSALKAALVTMEGEVAACESEPMQVTLLPGGGAEQDPEDWWHATTRATKSLLRKNPALAGGVVAVCCTGQWSGTVALDRDGHHLLPAIIWMDSRGGPYVQRITGGRIGLQGYGITRLWTWVRLTAGIPSRAGKDSIAHILYLKHDHPEIYARTYKFLEPKDYLNLRLTGKFAASYDSIILHWVTDNRNLSKIVYHPRLLRLAGIPRDKLPDLQRAVDILGPIAPEVARELGLSETVRVVMGTPDMQSAALGSGAVRDFEPHLHIGTSAWLACHVPFKKTDLTHNMASLPSAIPNRYLLANEQECAGACLTFLGDSLLYPQDDAAMAARPGNVGPELDHIAEHVPAGSDKVIFTPWLYGERTPVDDRTVRGGFLNLSLKTTRAHLVRAVFEGVAYNSRWLLASVESFTGRRMTMIHVLGGGANSNLWCQIHADVMGRTIRQLKDPVQANVRGAAFLAAVALGHLRFDDIPSRVQIARTYEPNPAHRRVYDELFREFVNIYERNKGMYARLNRS